MHLHLFGIIYADALARFSPNAVVQRAGISGSYSTEVNKGRKLAKYVELKK